MVVSYMVWIEPGTGREWRALPDPWNGRVSGLTPANCASFGWRAEDRSEEVPDDPVLYSKLKLIRAMKAAGIWDAVKAAIEGAGIWDEFAAAQELSADDPGFAGMLASLRTAYGDEAVDGILEASRL